MTEPTFQDSYSENTAENYERYFVDEGALVGAVRLTTLTGRKKP